MILKKVESINDAVKESAVLFSGATEVMRLNSSIDKESTVIDILPFLSKEIKKEKDKIKIGSAATFEDLISSELIPEKLKEASRYMRSPELRAQATIGGNIASWRDDSYLIPALTAFGATLLVLTKEGEKEISIKEYKEGAIISITIDPSVDVKLFRESLTSHSHAFVTLAKGKDIALAIKSGGIYFDEKDAKYVTDPYASKEYKKYLVDLFLKEAL